MPNPNPSAPNARAAILARLRQNALPLADRAPAPVSEADWLRRQPPLGDLAERFIREQEAVGSLVKRVPTWEALPVLAPAWLKEHGVRSVITGRVERLEPLRRALADAGMAVGRYDRPVEQKRAELFNTDCGITGSVGGIAETGSIVLIPGAEEPRLLSLAVPIHLALVERARLHPTLLDFIAGGVYQRDVPTNLVLVSGASRTADIELTLAMGVHGPKLLLVALIG
jgi:L-lactate dehydrogenase complex protein LldG